MNIQINDCSPSLIDIYIRYTYTCHPLFYYNKLQNFINKIFLPLWSHFDELVALHLNVELLSILNFYFQPKLDFGLNLKLPMGAILSTNNANALRLMWDKFMKISFRIISNSIHGLNDCNHLEYKLLIHPKKMRFNR